VEELLRRFYDVRILIRTPCLGLFPEKVEQTQGDVRDASTLRAAVEGVDLVYHLAAKLHVNRSSAATIRDYQEVNVEGTRGLVEAAEGVGVSRIVYFSSVSVYGTSQTDQVLDESSPVAPQTPYAESKAEGEQIVRAARSRDDGRALGVVLRFAAVYGARMKGNYVNLVRLMRRGCFLPLGAGLNRRTLVYDRDAISAALLAGTHPAALGQTYNVTDGRIHSFNEILHAISQALERPVPKYHLPASPIRFLVSAIEACFGRIGRNPPLNRMMIEKLLEDLAVSGEKIQRELGFSPRYDLISGWSHTLNMHKGAWA